MEILRIIQNKVNKVFEGTFELVVHQYMVSLRFLCFFLLQSLIMSKILFKVPILAESSVNYFSVYFIILFVNPVGRYFELLIFPKVMSFHWGFLLDFMKNHFHTPFCKEGNSVAHGTVFERWDNFQWCFQSTPLVLDPYNSF